MKTKGTRINTEIPVSSYYPIPDNPTKGTKADRIHRYFLGFCSCMILFHFQLKLILQLTDRSVNIFLSFVLKKDKPIVYLIPMQSNLCLNKLYRNHIQPTLTAYELTQHPLNTGLI